MRLSDIEKKAKTMGIKDSWMLSRKELIRAIQKTEGASACFGTAQSRCDQMACCWRDDCLTK